MRVFISWSGELSKQLAEAIRDWLPNVLQYVKPYFTVADTEKGARWENEISKQLEASNFCIIALTRESLNSNWIMFEAGAISRSVEKTRICAILFGIEPIDVKGPLAAFQATRFSKEEVCKLVKTINANAGDAAIESERLDRSFDMWWPRLEESESKIISEAGSAAKAPRREERDLLEEVVGQSRAHAEQLSEIQRWINSIVPAAAVFEFLMKAGTGKSLADLIKPDEQHSLDRDAVVKALLRPRSVSGREGQVTGVSDTPVSDNREPPAASTKK
jgi:TIR domain